MEPYSKVGISVLRDCVSQRETDRRLGRESGAVSNMMGYAAPPGHQQAGALLRPKLGEHLGSSTMS